RKTVADIIPGALAWPLFAEDALWSHQMPQEACLLDDLQSFFGEFGDDGAQQRHISVVAHPAEPPQDTQIEMRLLKQEALLHLAYHNDLLHVVTLEGPNDLGELARTIVYERRAIRGQLGCHVRGQRHRG